MGGLEKIFIDRFSKPSKKIASNTALEAVINNIPRYVLEAITFGGILLIVLFLMYSGNEIRDILPILTLYVYAGYRLMPAIQQIYISLNNLRVVGPALNSLHKDLLNLSSKINNEKIETIKFTKSMDLNHISFKYENNPKMTINEVTLQIKPFTTIGFVGSTGSGKTTMIDIILGLLKAHEGKLSVDGKIINRDNLRSWQRSIGYVPQQIFLSDDTISANVAFGIESGDIDQEKVEKVCKIANLHNFIIDELPLQYKTTVGERGVRLSGGQRQRIGIARALYHRPQLLILDEATSSLDNVTENLIMESIYKLKKNITIIIIAHRLNTVKNCDKIFLFNKGKLEGQGTYDELIESSDQFKAFTKFLK